MRKNKLLIFVRYLALFFILLSLFLFNSSISTSSIIIFLLLLINSQIRFFSLNRLLWIICSILLDVGLILCLLQSHAIAICLYFILPVLDVILLLSRNYHVMFLVIFSIILTIYYRSFTNIDEIFSLLFLIIISCLASYIKEEHEKKLDAQVLYDELRISEEQLKQAKEELELYASSLTELAVLKERNRISRDIHDSVGHAISTAMIQLNAMEVIAKKEESSVTPLAANLREFLKNCLQEVRTAIAELKPNEYKTYQELYRIEELIHNFEKLSGVNVRLTVSKQKWELNPKLGLIIYRIIQEALSNALRHGQATEVRLVLNFAPENLILTIDNNGLGCPTFKKGVGLTSMTERISEMNGKLTFFPAQTGFKIQVILPKGKEEMYG